MRAAAISLLAVTALGLCLLGAIELGRRLGARLRARDPEGALPESGAVETAVLGLLGLLIAFSFSGAASRFDARRELVVQEANAIGTAYLRLDLLPAEPRDALRAKFRDYVDSRIETYRHIPDLDAVAAELARSAALQGEIWSMSVAALRDAPAPTASLVLVPLNEMIDITTTRTVAGRTHPPLPIFITLAALLIVNSVLVGYGMAERGRRSALHAAGFALVMAATTMMILDLEFPRIGFVRLDAYDQVLVDVRNGMR
jgi:hypothetical protein